MVYPQFLFSLNLALQVRGLTPSCPGPMMLPVTSRYGELVRRDEAAEELLLRVDVLSSLIRQAYSVHSNIALCQHLSWCLVTFHNLSIPRVETG